MNYNNHDIITTNIAQKYHFIKFNNPLFLEIKLNTLKQIKIEHKQQHNTFFSIFIVKLKDKIINIKFFCSILQKSE